MPGMSPDSNIPWWAPGRPLIVADPEKLTYFARANAVRAGVQNMPGALSGVAVGEGEWADPYRPVDSAPGDSRALSSQAFFSNPTLDTGNRQTPMTVADGSNSVDSSNIETPSGGGLLDSFFNAFNRMVGGQRQPTYAVAAPAAPSPWPWVAAAGIVGVGLLVLAKKKAH